MALLRICCSCYTILLLFSLTEAALKCDIIDNKNDHIICTPTDGLDNKLQRGLVSDNNDTIEIILKNCRISEVDYEAFENLYRLKYLDLTSNKISELKLGVLDSVLNIRHLRLTHNLLSTLPLGIFDKTPDLRLLELKGNKFKEIELGIFDPLPNLEWLFLSHNALNGKDLNPYIFDQNKKIAHITFEANDMSNAPENLLHAFNVLIKLNLNRCLLQEFPLFVRKRNLKTIQELILSSNQIRTLIDPTIFINLEDLNKLDLGTNIIESIDGNTFKVLKQLKIIILRENKLTSIPDTLFTDMKSLGNIDLSNNLITNIPVNAFRGTSLKNLNLGNNRITYLANNFCLELRNSGAMLNKFYFNRNPWQCSCLRELLEEVKKYQISYNSVLYDGRHPVCVTTKELFCKRHDEFNSVYTKMYDNLVLGRRT